MGQLFDKFKAALHIGGGNQKQVVSKSENVVATQSKGGEARSVLQAQVVIERHGYARTPTELFSDFDHAIKNYHKFGDTEPTDPPALLVTDWDIMVIQMVFRDNDPIKDKITIVDGVVTYKGIPLKHPTHGVVRYTPTPEKPEKHTPPSE